MNNHPPQRSPGAPGSAMGAGAGGPAANNNMMDPARLERIRQYQYQKAMQRMQQLKGQYLTEYTLPLNYPARVAPVLDDDDHDDDATNSGASSKTKNGTHAGKQRKQKEPLRTNKDFINARLLEAGLPLGGGLPELTTTNPSEMTLGEHGVKICKFIRDLEGTGCYDSVQVFLGNPSSDSDKNNGDDADDSASGPNDTQQQQQQQQQQAHTKFIPPIDITVHLKEKKWYKLYIGGGVNAEDLSSMGNNGSSSTPFGNGGGSISGSGSGGGFGGDAASFALNSLPKLQFETSASLLNLTGFTDITTASYLVDQTGTSSLKFTHDRPLCGWIPKDSAWYDWIGFGGMPRDPRSVSPEERDNHNNAVANNSNEGIEEAEILMNSFRGGSHTTLGIHATLHDTDYEYTRSSKEYTRSLGIRLSNHSLGSHRVPGEGNGNKPSFSPPESMAGPFAFLDWNISVKDVLPKRHSEFPFVLDCSKEVASHAGTYLKHSIVAGMLDNGCDTDDRYDPTMGNDGHLIGEVALPPGDVGFWKLKGGAAWHFPVELLRMRVFGVSEEEYDRMMLEQGANGEEQEKEENPSIIGMTLHSSINFGLIRPLTFGGLCSGKIPLGDRFYVGGPGQLRGFMPAGIGPRASKGGSNVPGGDALGGDLFYTSTIAASIPFPELIPQLRHNSGRIFGFANAGTCVSLNGLGGMSSLLGLPAWNQICNSTRLSVGGGISVGTPMGRMEATYAVPLRYGPRDARKAVQFGFGFSFG